MKKGQWVVSSCHLGKIVEIDIYRDDNLADIALYSRQGNKIGRESPAMGGPTTFEPACDLTYWKAIKTPVFPLPKYAYLEDIVEYL
jgi:hypothetical protein